VAFGCALARVQRVITGGGTVTLGRANASRGVLAGCFVHPYMKAKKNVRRNVVRTPISAPMRCQG